MKKTLFNVLEKTPSFLRKIGISKRTLGVLPVYKFLHNIFWPHEDIVEVQGSKMYLKVKGETVSIRKTFEGYAFNKIHEKATTMLFEKSVKRGDVVIDLGANIGYFTLLAAKIVGATGRVYAFEPESKNYSYLKKNIEINNYNWAKAYQKAVSDKNGTTSLYICDYDSGHHTINQNEGVKAYSRGRKVEAQSVDIETVTLDRLFEGNEDSINVIKMDVEGAEYLALKGMDNILRKNQKIKMFIEFFPLLIKKMGNSPEELIRKLMQDYGFTISIVPDDYDGGEGEMIKVDNVGDVLERVKGEEDHINLFLEKNDNDN